MLSNYQQAQFLLFPYFIYMLGLNYVDFSTISPIFYTNFNDKLFIISFTP